jgi:hypothetical protein
MTINAEGLYTQGKKDESHTVWVINLLCALWLHHPANQCHCANNEQSCKMKHNGRKSVDVFSTQSKTFSLSV